MGNNMKLILGGTGKTGRRIAQRLAERGIPVRIGSRSGERPFDWQDRSTWLPALEDVEAAYVTYSTDLTFPGAADDIRVFAKLAFESRVKRLVLLSGRGEEGAQRAERAVQDSGAEWTIVRASWFCQNFNESFLLEPVLSGEVRFPAGDVGEPFIDVEDIADVATAALTEAKHAGQVYEVTGPRLLTFGEAVAEISKVSGREISYTRVTTDEYAAELKQAGVPADFVDPFIELIAAVLDGRNAFVTDGVQRAVGHPPRDFSDYARGVARSGVWTPEQAALVSVPTAQRRSRE